MQRNVASHRIIAIVGALLLFSISDPAYAFRCGSRIVQDGMHEAEVIRLCGEPVSTRHVGYVVRAYRYGNRTILSTRHDHPAGYGHYHQEVVVTEMIFNFGPRKLMRKLTFEGGILTSIRTMGYGYIEKDEQ